MSTEDIAATNACKQRFKGLENFLKRIAFNLGNTPSQTEVKIISCIPIDVTDLQQKILHLEKQLEEVQGVGGTPSDISKSSKTGKHTKPPKQKRTSVNTAIIETKFPIVATAAISCKALDCDRSTSPTCINHKRKSNVSFIFPELANDTTLTASQFNCEVTHGITEPEKPKVEHHCPASKMAEPKENDNRRNFFKKKKNIIKSRKGKSPYVYYAQTMNSSPFNRSDIVDEEHKSESSDVLTRSFLANMINKQYRPRALGDNLSLISQFSSPVCRDVQPHCEGPCRYESDICSCCHGPFHNIDARINKLNNPQTYMLNEMSTGNAYYDTNQYDLVPVKEKPVKNKKDLEMPRRKDVRNHIDMECWPEHARTRYRYQSLYPLPTTHNYKLRPRNEYTTRDKLENNGRRTPARFIRTDATLRKETKRRKEIYRRERLINIETSKSCSIDFGAAYPKKTSKKPKQEETSQPIPITKKNAECLTTVINNNECQTAMSTAEVNTADIRTEATLNQIKSILQSVLAEVKVSSQTKSQLLPEKHKKDAVVQKGPSQNNVHSSLINSFTYSPYTMTPSAYMPSCSRQLSPSQFYYPQPGMKCFQNFPLFIQTPGRHMCASCFRNSSHVKSGYVKQATTIATNTDELKENRSKETEKLIKEIYKSMALTVDLPNKDTSLSEYDEMTKSFNDFTTPIILKTEPKRPAKKIKNVVQAVSELFMKKDMVDTSDTQNTTLESKLVSNETSTQSQLVTTTDTEPRIRIDKYVRNNNVHPRTAHEENRPFREAVAKNIVTITETETTSSDGDTDTIVVKKDVAEPKHKKEKESLLSKMFKSVFKSREKPKKRGEKTESEEETTSDSDDYQTVYSQRIEKTVRNRGRSQNIPKRKTHSKISYKQTYQRERSPEKKRSPYMEQEYRRYWDEHLMFHDNRQKISSDRLHSDHTTPQKSAYYQTYETRRALAQHKSHSPRALNYSNENKLEASSAAKGLAWLKKHKMGIHCGEQWKKLLLEG